MLAEKLQHYAENDLLRERMIIQQRLDNHAVIEGQTLLNFCSNDYLGMTTHPEVKKAFIQGIEQYGVGSGASPLVSGYYPPQKMLEEKFAEFLQCEQAIFFNSGYHANLAVMTVLADRNSAIFADKYIHASLLDGIQLSRAKLFRYAHQNITHCIELMQQYAKKNNVVVTESVFSMTGDITPLDLLCPLVHSKSATMVIDDAHGVGILGENGRGAIEYFTMQKQEKICIIAPLGKAFGNMGAVVAGSHVMMDGILQFARSYRYSTALPPAIAVANLKVLTLVQQENWRRKKLIALIEFFIKQAKQHKLLLVSEDITPIKCILIDSNCLALKIQNNLMNKGYLVACIRPPTVPNGTTRLRISLNCMHTEDEILRLIKWMAKFSHE